MSLPLFRKPKDALTRHDRELAAEIERLEKEIARLSNPKAPSPPAKASAKRPSPVPRTSPGGASRVPDPAGLTPASSPPCSAVTGRPTPGAYPSSPLPLREPTSSEAPRTVRDDHFNAQGVRKFDLAAAWKRLAGWFSSPPPTNPQMIRYLASGSVQGLRPLRYERRVARNRFIGLFLLLFVILWGLLAVYFGRP